MQLKQVKAPLRMIIELMEALRQAWVSSTSSAMWEASGRTSHNSRLWKVLKTCQSSQRIFSTLHQVMEKERSRLSFLLIHWKERKWRETALAYCSQTSWAKFEGGLFRKRNLAQCLTRLLQLRTTQTWLSSNHPRTRLTTSKSSALKRKERKKKRFKHLSSQCLLTNHLKRSSLDSSKRQARFRVTK